MEIEVGEQMQHLQEQVHEVVEELHKEHEKQAHESYWINEVAISTGIFAGLAAIAAMHGNFLAEEGTIAQIEATDQLVLYQAQSTKADVDQSTSAILQSLGKPVPSSIAKQVDQLEQQKKNIRDQAINKRAEARVSLKRHEFYAYSVTALQVAISLASVSALLKRRTLWYISLGCAVVGVSLMAFGSSPAVHGFGHSSPSAAQVKH